MKKLKITLAPINEGRKLNPYRQRETGNLVYVFNIEGSKEEIEEYKKDNPKAITDVKTGQVLFFTTKFTSKSADLIKGEKGWYVDTITEQQFAEFCKVGGVEYAKMKMAELG